MLPTMKASFFENAYWFWFRSEQNDQVPILPKVTNIGKLHI
jgi:hypothetical protein